MARIAMRDEVLALSAPDAVRALWRRRWTLAAAIAMAAVGAFFAASLLPATWESQVVVEVGQVGDKPLEGGAALVRRINVGTLRCGSADGAGAINANDRVTANLDPVAEFVEIRLTANGRTADEAVARTTRALTCLVARHTELFAMAQRRDAAYRAALDFQLTAMKASAEHLEQMVRNSSAAAAAGGDALLLQTRLDGVRAQHLELAEQVRDFDESHAADIGTLAISDISRPSSPVW